LFEWSIHPPAAVGEFVSFGHAARMNFPELRNGQHAVVAAEVQTGIILSLDGKRWRKDQPAECWRVFDSLAAAREFAAAEVAKNPALEFLIHDTKDHSVERIAK
jgi:hypothetical protein